MCSKMQSTQIQFPSQEFSSFLWESIVPSQFINKVVLRSISLQTQLLIEAVYSMSYILLKLLPASMLA